MIEFETCPRWVRGVCGGVPVVDSRRVLMVREPGRLPTYWFPREDVRMDLLARSGERPDELKGPTTRWTLQVGDRVAPDAAWTCDEPPPDAARLAGHVGFRWPAMDAWYEEDDEVFVHPRDPRHRVDVLRSSRHVRVVVLGETVAETSRPSLLFETGLPTRYYIPRQDVRMDLLVPSDTTTQCPYKGIASYFGVRVGDRVASDVAWTYRFPIPECPKVENLVCFFDERVDALYVDGRQAERPETPWSRR